MKLRYLALSLLPAVMAAAVPTPSVQALAANLRAADPSTRATAACDLRAFGESLKPLIPALLELLPDEARTATAACDSGWWQGPTTPGREAARTLADLGEAALQPLIKALASPAAPARRHAAQALADIQDERALPALLKAIKDPDWRVRLAALEAVEESGVTGTVIAALVDVVDDSHWQVRQSAVNILSESGSARAVAPLVRALGDEHWSVRQTAAEGLGELEDARGLDPLIRAVTDSHWRVRQASAEALGEMQNTRALEALLVALTDGHWAVRMAAAEALGGLGDLRATAALRHAGKDDHSRVRAAVAEAMDDLQDQDD